MDAELRRRIAIGRQDVRALDAGLGAQCGDETPDTGIGRVGNLRQQDGNIEFELFGHHAVSALVLVSARASRRISMPPLIAIISSEERRVGIECVQTGRSRWSPYN